jgi:hypothetical protein
MPSWLLKALTQRLIGSLPNPHYWNELLQTRITRSIHLSPDQFAVKLGDCRTHLEHLRASQRKTSHHFAALELGTGWFPVVPIGLYLCGASQVWTWDIVEHLRLERVRFALDSFLRLNADGELERHLPGLLPERLNKLRELVADRSATTPAELLDRLAIRYQIGDATHSRLPSRSVDLFTSIGVLEYLPTEALVPLFREFLRIAATDAVMSHLILFDDQYAYYDPQITPLNFLRFSDRAWRQLNNPIIPLNRLRITDYRRALRDAGFRIIDETVVDRCDAAVLAKTRLAPRFRCYPEEDLLVLRAWLAATPANERRRPKKIGC